MFFLFAGFTHFRKCYITFAGKFISASNAHFLIKLNKIQ